MLWNKAADEVHAACSIVLALTVFGRPERVTAEANRALKELEYSIRSCALMTGFTSTLRGKRIGT
jgi:hypothetical protein